MSENFEFFVLITPFNADAQAVVVAPVIYQNDFV